ncbi:MAG TPA: L-threonylcarbamoyladenylate synthase [Nitrospiraceae bacterium]|nr:L-threonylcarbamoyladenylate synthase [Nitrospiraceae bacterium]
MSRRLALAPDPSVAVLETARRLLHQSGVLAMPTESYYALGALAYDDEAVHRVCTIKGRGEDKPILVLISDRAQLAQLVTDIPFAAQVLMDRFWPGPLTLVFRAARDLPRGLTQGTGTIGIRQPARPDLLRLLHHVGPLTGTSANRTGHSPMRTAEEVLAELGEDVDLILDGGETVGGLPSTLIDVTGTVRMLREGPLKGQAIRAVLKESGILMSDQSV